MAPTVAMLTINDVSRILTEEARAKHARWIVAKRLQPLAAQAADLLPIVPRRSQTTPVVSELRQGLRRWASRKIPDNWSEGEVEQFVATLVDLLDSTGQQAGAASDAAAQSVQRTRKHLGEAVRELFDARQPRTVSANSVQKYLGYSYPTNGEPRYAEPMPYPQLSYHPDTGERRTWALYWSPDQEEELRRWYRRRPGPGVGGGRPRKTDTDNK
jgi:hypothetical protein